jgi:hypothetical protein
MVRPSSRCQSPISVANPNAVSVAMPRTQPSRVTTAVNAESAGHLEDRRIQAGPAIQGGQHGVEGGVIGQLQPAGVEAVRAQPPLVPRPPRLSAVVDDPLPQKQLRQSVPGRHQIPAAILTGPDQIPRGFLLHRGHPHRGDLANMQQPGQMPGIANVGLDPIPRWALQLRRRRHHALDPRRLQRPRQTEPRWAGLVGHRHGRRQPADPVQDLAVIRTQPVLHDFTGFPDQPARNDRSCVHIKTNTRTLMIHWASSQLWLYRPGPNSCRQPTFTCE